MAKKDRSPLYAGLFIIASLILVGLVIVGIKGLRGIFTPAGDRKVRFALADDIGGIRLGDDVRIGGFKVGVVRDIDVQGVENNQDASILVTFSLPEKYPLHADAHVAVQGTLTGSSWLNIDNLGSGPMLAADGEVPGHPSETSTLLASLRSSAPELQAMLHDIHTITVPKVNVAIDKASSTLDSARTFADHGATMSDEVASLFGDSKPDLRGTLAHLNKITGSFQDKLPDILDHLDSVLSKMNDTVASAQSALQDIKIAASNTRDLTGSAKDIIMGNRSKLDGMIASLKSTADNLKAASVEIRRSPWRLLYKPEPGEMENLELFDAARQFAEGASAVNDASAALRDAMANPSTDHATMQKLMNKLSDTFANFNQVERKLWNAVKD